MTTNTIYYWTACKKFWGSAIGAVLVLGEAGVDYKILTPEDAPSDNRFTYPSIALKNGLTIGQVPAILNILGAEFGLCGKSLEEAIYCQQAVLDLNDVFVEAQSGKFTDDPRRAQN